MFAITSLMLFHTWYRGTASSFAVLYIMQSGSGNSWIQLEDCGRIILWDKIEANHLAARSSLHTVKS